jgi:hypothetical protein
MDGLLHKVYRLSYQKDKDQEPFSKEIVKFMYASTGYNQ